VLVLLVVAELERLDVALLLSELEALLVILVVPVLVWVVDGVVRMQFVKFILSSWVISRFKL
jgi:hypothetical protein